MAYVVAFLASPRSIAINGEVVALGGGSGQVVFHHTTVRPEQENEASEGESFGCLTRCQC
ncbi:MAG: hypothetical protein IIC97_04845 [Chloroflexi bacterium]|nr:hypothetical protein [Chloroflexota bacterium]